MHHPPPDGEPAHPLWHCPRPRRGTRERRQASQFTAGEILFLFTADPHLDGDDPFPLQADNDALDDPLENPDERRSSDLWALRRELLAVGDGEPDEVEAWSWTRIVSTLRDELGLPDGPGGVNRLLAVGERFFPAALEREGQSVPTAARQFRVGLPATATTPAMWDAPGPFRYDPLTQELWISLPLRDADVNAKLSEIRPLSAVEQAAVSQLYFAPRAALAPFSLLFQNFGEAVDRLISEADEDERFRELQREFARFYRRCDVIARHLVAHVEAATGHCHPDGAPAAWWLLRQLWGEENRGLGSWEDDAGKAPDVTWKPQPTGGAFAALLGLAGTGLVGEYAAAGSDPAWRELRGPLSAFGPSRDAWNAPVTTVIPSIGLALSPEQQRFVTVRNGFAMRDADGEPLFGAQPFTVRWHGALLVEQPGEYRFEAGGHAAERECDHCDEQRWIVTLRRGQRTWSLLNHRWDADDAPAHCSDPLVLRRGVYEIDARLAEPESAFARDEHACPGHTGFEVRYCGPDSDDELVAIPFERLFRIAADEPLDSAITVGEAARRFLHDRYTSSLSGHPRRYADMRRLDDGLRGRARDALVAYLCGMGRVALPFAPGSFALQARDLGALLLQDVETGLCERASRIEDAISAAHAFVQRARLGLEPQLAVSPAFVALWDSHFATFGEWRCHKQRELYRENWIEWDELSSARDSEAFRFLEAKLREQKLTVAVPGGQDWWPSAKLPPAPCLDLLQVAEPSRLSLLNSPSEGLGLLGSLERAATPSWLAPVLRAPREDFPPRDAPLATSQASIVQQGGGSSGLQ